MVCKSTWKTRLQQLQNEHQHVLEFWRVQLAINEVLFSYLHQLD